METVQDRPRVFHIDDDEDFLELFAITFGNWLEIHSFNDGRKAILQMDASLPDVIVTDYEMPDYNGIDLLNDIRRYDEFIPVIFYTGQGNEEIAREAFISGASDYFTKDLFGFVHREKFVNVVRRACRTRQAEIERRNSEAKYQRVFENIRDVYYETDLDGKLLEISPSIEEVSKFKREELIGRSVIDLYADKTFWFNGVADLLQHGEFRDYEIPLKDKDGRLKWCSINVKLILDKDGTPCKVIGSLHDITERKESARELEKIKALLLAAIENSPAGIIIADAPQGNIRIANRAAMAIRGKSHEIITKSDNHKEAGEDWWIPGHVDGDESGHRDIPLTRALLNREVIRNQKAVIRGTNGDLREILVSAAPVYDSDGTVIAGVEVLTDVTDQREVEESLRDSESLYKSTINALSDGIHMIDRNHRILMVNDTLRFWCRDLGLDDQLEGRDLFDVCFFLGERVREEYDKVFNSGRIMVTREKQSIKGCKIFTETTKIPIFDGKIVNKIVTVIRDITKTRLAQESMRAARDRLRTVLRTIPYLTLVLKEDGIIEDLYPGKSVFFNLPENSSIGASLFSFLPREYHDVFKNAIQAATTRKAVEICIDNNQNRFTIQMLTCNPRGNRKIICLIRDVQ